MHLLVGSSYNATYLQLFQGESLASTNASVVPESRAADDRLKGGSRTRENTTCLFNTGSVPPLLTCRLNFEFTLVEATAGINNSTCLIEPGLHISLPLFVEVSIRDHVVPFRRHGGATLRYR